VITTQCNLRNGSDELCNSCQPPVVEPTEEPCGGAYPGEIANWEDWGEVFGQCASEEEGEERTHPSGVGRVWCQCSGGECCWMH